MSTTSPPLKKHRRWLRIVAAAQGLNFIALFLLPVYNEYGFIEGWEQVFFYEDGFLLPLVLSLLASSLAFALASPRWLVVVSGILSVALALLVVYSIAMTALPGQDLSADYGVYSMLIMVLLLGPILLIRLLSLSPQFRG